MIHQVYLPEITRKRLTDVVALQMVLLTYAASRDTLDEGGCATYLDRCARFRGRGAQIAAWIWHAPSRYERLEKFAEGPTAQKLRWSKRLTREAFAFLQHPIGHIDTHARRTAPPWERAGANFLKIKETSPLHARKCGGLLPSSMMKSNQSRVAVSMRRY